MATALCDEHTHLLYQRLSLAPRLWECNGESILPVQEVRYRMLNSLLAGYHLYPGLSRHLGPGSRQDFQFQTRTLLDHLESVEKVCEGLHKYINGIP